MDRLVKTTVFCLALSPMTALVYAQTTPVIYKHVDDRGRVTYANSPMKGAVKVELEPLTVIPSSPSGSLSNASGSVNTSAPIAIATVTPTAKTTPASIEAVSQKRREETAARRLEEQLQAEEKLLNDARGKLETEQRESDNVRAMRATHAVGNAAGTTQKPVMTAELRQYVERHFERIRNLQDQVATLEGNVEKLRDRMRDTH